MLIVAPLQLTVYGRRHAGMSDFGTKRPKRVCPIPYEMGQSHSDGGGQHELPTMRSMSYEGYIVGAARTASGVMILKIISDRIQSAIRSVRRRHNILMLALARALMRVQGGTIQV